ncbi:aldo/keto reductase [Gorillibacterium sp. sgz5001074]|uniref:aldo/keto reductase n=1 Tax=Gorillibacterium sp. sgz5001074 TaxID=3446695 RepID=UPI003F66E86B
MQYRTFGKTGESVSVLGFGCMRLPVVGGVASQIDDAKAIPMLRHAIDSGVNYVDTAYPYHGEGFGKAGFSEPFVGRALRDGYREKVFLATKLPSWLVETREDMDRLLNEQLQRLETDRIDFYLVHALNAGTWSKLVSLGIGKFLDSALKDGRIRYAGFSFHDDLPVFKEIVDAYDWSFCQIQYNYLDEYFQAGKEGMEYAAARGLGISIMEPLRGGRLVNDLPEGVRKAFEGASQRRTPAEWALRWVWNHPEAHVTLSGMGTMEQVEENMRTAAEAAAGSMTAKELDVVAQARDVFRWTKVSCTGCEYCMPCPVGVDIPANFKFYNEYYFLSNDNQRNGLKKVYDTKIPADARASSCVECGTCEEHCPQHIAIPQELRLAAEVLG